MKTAVQFGAGKIGRGFLGQLFTESGYDVVFVDVVEKVIQEINRRRSYTIRIAGETVEEVEIRGIRGIDGRDREAAAQAFAEADIACTAVGVNYLADIAPTIALGVQKRVDAGNAVPINVIICENLSHASDHLRGLVRESLPAKYHEVVEKRVGFVESVVSRMVRDQTAEELARDPLLIVVEPYKRLPVDKRGFIGEIPEIVGLEPRDNFQAYVDRKLFTHNLGHAASAYFGYLRGLGYLYECMADQEIRNAAAAALAETGRALIQKHGFSPDEHQAHIDDLLSRFANRNMGDQVLRVGRDPIRKLGPEDRLVGGARLALEYGIFPTNVCKAIAAALQFDPEEDEAAQELQVRIREIGAAGVLRELCRIAPESELGKTIIAEIPKVREQFAR